MRNQVLKNYLTPKHYAKLVKTCLQKLRIPSHQCCKNHGDLNVKTYRLVKILNLNSEVLQKKMFFHYFKIFLFAKIFLMLMSIYFEIFLKFG